MNIKLIEAAVKVAEQNNWHVGIGVGHNRTGDIRIIDMQEVAQCVTLNYTDTIEDLDTQVATYLEWGMLEGAK